MTRVVRTCFTCVRPVWFSCADALRRGLCCVQHGTIPQGLEGSAALDSDNVVCIVTPFKDSQRHAQKISPRYRSYLNTSHEKLLHLGAFDGIPSSRRLNTHFCSLFFCKFPFESPHFFCQGVFMSSRLATSLVIWSGSPGRKTLNAVIVPHHW